MQRSTPPRYRPPLKRPETVESSLGSFVGRCPHLGTRADAGTALAFAADANQCYSTRLPVPVSTVHQQSYCLSGGYAECPVFQQSVRAGVAAPLVTAPPSWGVPQEETVTNVVIAPARSRSTRRRRRMIVPLVLLLALLAGGWWLWPGFLSQSEDVQQPSTNNLAIGAATATPESAAPGSVSGDTGQAIVITNPTATPELPAPTDEAPRPPADSGLSLPVLPTASAAPGIVEAAECIIPDWWVPYIVQTNDSLLALAQLRGLLAEDVIAANCLLTGDLVVGQVILLPPLATVIGLPPLLPTRVVDSIAGAAIIIVATQTIATPLPIIFPSSTPDAGSPGVEPTSPPPPEPTSPPPATATAIGPTRVPPTATPPSLFPTATPTTPGPTRTPGPTATPPSTVPTVTPPFAGPTQTPPPLRP